MELLIFFSVVEGAHSSISAWESELKASDLIEGGGMQELAGAISAARKKHSEILGDCDGENFIALDVPDEEGLAVFEVVVEKSSLISGIVNRFIESSPLNVIDDMILWCLNLPNRLWTSLFVTPCQSVLQIIYSQDTLRVLVLENNSELFIAV